MGVSKVKEIVNEKKVIDELYKLIDLVGTKETLYAIGDIYTLKAKKIPLAKSVYKKICSVLDLDENFIYEKGNITENKKVGAAFCFYLLRNKFNFEYSEICYTLNISYSIQWCSRLYSLIRDAKLEKPKNPLDILIAKHNKELVEFSNNLVN